MNGDLSYPIWYGQGYERGSVRIIDGLKHLELLYMYMCTYTCTCRSGNFRRQNVLIDILTSPFINIHY